jgi:tripartite-type tricarboxylate transporter receptor subunit TctC
MLGKLFGTLVVCVIVAFAAPSPSQAAAKGKAAQESYPTKPIRLVVPFAPGGTNDILGRLVAQHLSQTLGQTMIVDNRTGADGLIGTELVAKAPADGYTLLVVSSGYPMNAAIKKLPYDPIRTFVFPSKLGSSYCVLSVNPSVPAHSVGDLVALAKAKPGQIVLATSGGFMHFASALFKSLSKQDFNIVVYKGGAPAMMDTISGQTQAHLAVSLPALPFLRSGKLRGLAVSTIKRVDALPDMPTIDEAGVKGYDAANWYSIAAPAATPKPIVTKLRDEIVRFFNLPETQKQISAMGGIIDLKGPDEMRAIIPAEIQKWRKVAIDAGMPREW